MNTRLEQFLSAENISQSQLADTLGVARASISHILAGRNKPGYEFITNLMRSYPSLNMEWLLLGKGKMYKNALENQILPVHEKEAVQIFNSQVGDQSQDGVAPNLFESQIDQEEATENKQVTVQEQETASSQEKQIQRIIVLYSDGSYKELF